jgi:hypothetical protein
VKLKESSLTCCNKDDPILERAKRDEVSVRPNRRSYQTTLRCKSRKTAVVNGQRKGWKIGQVYFQEMNESETLLNIEILKDVGQNRITRRDAEKRSGKKK